MSEFAFTDCYLELNSVVASTWAKKVTLDVEVVDLDRTTFGGSGWKALLGGLKSGTVNVDLNQDFDASQVDDTLWPLLGTLFTVKIRPTSAAIGPTNPEYSGQCLLTKYSPLDGSVGDLASTSITIPTSGVWARATA